MRTLIVGVVAVVAGLSSPAFAIPGVAVSLGQGVQVNDGVELSPFNVEGLLYTSFGVAKLDLGFLFNMNKFDVEEADLLVVRPGVRLNVPGLVYFRGAIPITFEDGTDFGFLLGVGMSLLNIGVASVFAEVDATFMEEVDFTDSFPVEARLGLEIGF